MENRAPVKLDLKKQLKHLYLPSAKEVTVVDVPEMKFIAVDGRIEPDATPGTSPGFAEAIGALLRVRIHSQVHVQAPAGGPHRLHGHGARGVLDDTGGGSRLRQLQRLAVDAHDHAARPHQPGDVRRSAGRAEEEARQGRAARGGAAGEGGGSAVLDRVRFENFREGLCLQIMHIGPYADEPRTLEKMATFAEARGYVFRGRHHEIYLGDPRTAKPENLKTVLRHAVLPAE